MLHGKNWNIEKMYNLPCQLFNRGNITEHTTESCRQCCETVVVSFDFLVRHIHHWWYDLLRWEWQRHVSGRQWRTSQLPGGRQVVHIRRHLFRCPVCWTYLSIGERSGLEVLILDMANSGRKLNILIYFNLFVARNNAFNVNTQSLNTITKLKPNKKISIVCQYNLLN